MRFAHAITILGATLASFMPLAAGAQTVSKELVVVSWGGDYTRSQMLAFVNPFREKSGEWVNMITYGGGLDDIREQVRSANVTWDLVDFEQSDLLRGCEEGLLAKIDHSILPPGADGTPAADDFINGALTECGIGQSVYGTVVAFDAERVGDTPPSKLADFFDVRRFPGKRGMRRDPRVAMEWALLADGVAPGDVYATLGTEAGQERAFRMLDNIKPHLVWWQNGTEPITLLDNDEVLMTSVWNGRTHGPIVDDGKPIGLVWDGQVWDLDSWGIPAGSYNVEKAQAFIQFATATEQLAAQTDHISYGPARRSSMAMLSDEVKARLPTSEAHLATALQIDAQWWADNLPELSMAFEAWLVSGGRGLAGSAR